MRRLAAILAADVAGYSRLMQEDEHGTVSALAAARRLFAETAAGRAGRIVNAPGDSILAEFASVVDAVECAIAVQGSLARVAGRMQFRIGVNVGDVLVDEAGAIYGDGVNIAARLEGLAPPGGVCLSKAVYDQVKARLHLAFEDLGEKTLKNIAEPVHAFRAGIAGPAAPAAPAATRPNSIAVLAFSNMTGDPAQELFCDGISEDIITDLAKISGLVVIGRPSAFSYRGKAGDLRQVARELGVRYVMEGSVRLAGDCVRVNAQLIEGESGAHVWAQRYDRPLEDISAVGDDITEEIVTALEVQLAHGEQARVWRKALKTRAARDAFNAGMNANFLGTPQDTRRAREFFLQACELEPSSGAPLGQAAMTHCLEVMHGWTGEAARSLAEARRLAERGLEVDATVAANHAALGIVALFEHRHDEALENLVRANDLRPVCAAPKALLSYAQLYAGLWDRAVRNAEDAVELNPVFPLWYRYLSGAARHFGGRHEEALPTLRKVRVANPRLIPARLAMIAANMALSLNDEASAEAAAILSDRPDFSVGGFAHTQPFRDEEVRERYLESLRAAGLPD